MPRPKALGNKQPSPPAKQTHRYSHPLGHTGASQAPVSVPVRPLQVSAWLLRATLLKHVTCANQCTPLANLVSIQQQQAFASVPTFTMANCQPGSSSLNLVSASSASATVSSIPPAPVLSTNITHAVKQSSSHQCFPLSSNLVAKIQSRQFVAMKEWLADNMLHSHLQALPTSI